MKRNIIPALVYGTTVFALFFYLDGLYGAGPVTHRLWLILGLKVATVLFAAACVLSWFAFRVGLLCAVAGACFAWPWFAVAMVGIPWRSLFSIVQYSHWLDLLMAMAALVVATLYAARRAFLLLSREREAERHRRALTLVAALYAATIFVVPNWRGIWEWLFRIRYGG